MANTPRILAFAGSLRADSYNKKLVKVAAQGAKAAGAEVTYVDLQELPLPVYDGDLEAKSGIPENALHLKRLFKSHDGLLIASPEYNSSYSGALKNLIDWVSRPEPGEPLLAAFTGKVAGVMSASPGGLGGMRGLMTLRMLLGNIKVWVLPDQVTVGQAHEAFNPDGSFKDAQQQATVEALGAQLAKVLTQLRS